MSAVQVEFPDDVLARARKVAAQQKLPLEQIIVEAVQQLVSQTEWFEERVKRGRNVDIKAILKKAPDVPPIPGDEIEP